MRWFFIVIFAGVLTLPLALRAADAPSVFDPAVEEEAARQLRIYREALLQGSTEEIRVDAAVGLLLGREAAGREVLASALQLSDNPSSVKAVCRALIKSRAVGASVGLRDLFLEPLLALLAGSDTDLSRLAAEALLIFRYEAIEGRLNEIVNDTAMDRRVRLNVLYTLQIRPEPEALVALIELLDKADPDVSRAAEAALKEAFGISAGTARIVWEQILRDLREKSPEDIHRERLLRQEMNLRQMQAERDRWQRLYLGALDKQFETADEASRSAMTLERLDSDLTPIRLWALDKIERSSSNGPAGLREKLLSLLGDETRQVRLRTARVLNNMSALNPAEKLLERFRLEQDGEVALAMFEALGEACFFAFSPGSKIELPGEIKLQTLEIAGGYLNSDDIETAKKGGEIARKLLELDGFSDELAEHYLQLFSARYALSVERGSTLRADLLAMMARLSGRGAQRERAARMYQPYFVEAVGISDNPAVRLAAATGLSHIDKAQALRLYKQHNVLQDASAALRQLVFDAAGQAGQPADLEWLSGYVSSNGQSEAAVEAFGAICQRAEGQIVQQWAERLDKNGASAALVRQMLELAEQKAVSEKNEMLLAESRVRLAGWFVRQRQPEELAAYLQRAKDAGASLVFPDATGAELLDALIFAGFHEAAAELVQSRLERGSLGRNSLILEKLDTYFYAESVTDTAKQGLLERLKALKYDTGNPFFVSRIDHWNTLLSPMGGVTVSD